jgi:hypothetical protein
VAAAPPASRVPPHPSRSVTSVNATPSVLASTDKTSRKVLVPPVSWNAIPVNAQRLLAAPSLPPVDTIPSPLAAALALPSPSAADVLARAEHARPSPIPRKAVALRSSPLLATSANALPPVPVWAATTVRPAAVPSSVYPPSARPEPVSTRQALAAVPTNLSMEAAVWAHGHPAWSLLVLSARPDVALRAHAATNMLLAFATLARPQTMPPASPSVAAPSPSAVEVPAQLRFVLPRAVPPSLLVLAPPPDAMPPVLAVLPLAASLRAPLARIPQKDLTASAARSDAMAWVAV